MSLYKRKIPSGDSSNQQRRIGCKQPMCSSDPVEEQCIQNSSVCFVNNWLQSKSKAWTEACVSKKLEDADFPVYVHVPKVSKVSSHHLLQFPANLEDKELSPPQRTVSVLAPSAHALLQSSRYGVIAHIHDYIDLFFCEEDGTSTGFTVLYPDRDCVEQFLETVRPKLGRNHCLVLCGDHYWNDFAIQHYNLSTVSLFVYQSARMQVFHTCIHVHTARVKTTDQTLNSTPDLLPHPSLCVPDIQQDNIAQPVGGTGSVGDILSRLSLSQIYSLPLDKQELLQDKDNADSLATSMAMPL